MDQSSQYALTTSLPRNRHSSVLYPAYDIYVGFKCSLTIIVLIPGPASAKDLCHWHPYKTMVAISSEYY